MAVFPSEPTSGDLRRIFEQAFKASGKSYEDFLQRVAGTPIERSPVAQMYASSPIGSAAKQILPNRVGDTQIGRLIASVLPERLRKPVENVGLGGMSAKEKADFSAARARDVDLQLDSVELGRVPTESGEVALGPGNYRAKGAQAAGIVAADLASDGMRNIWWFLNAPQAVAQVAMFQGINQAAEKQKRAMPVGLDQGKFKGQEPLIRSRNLRMAAAAPAWIAASMGVGNFMRQPGYKAVLPSEDDPTQTSNPAGELASRYFLGRSGSLLPYDEFRKERPDVSRQEYNAYKNYLFTGKSPIKATMEGPQGPEVTFMGKSIPLATGILPMAAAVVGARRGVKRGMTKVAARGGYDVEMQLRDKVKVGRESLAKGDISQDELDQKIKDYRQILGENENIVAKSIIANTSGATAGAALSGYVLESLRRALKGNAPVTEEDF